MIIGLFAICHGSSKRTLNLNQERVHMAQVVVYIRYHSIVQTVAYVTIRISAFENRFKIFTYGQWKKQKQPEPQWSTIQRSDEMPCCLWSVKILITLSAPWWVCLCLNALVCSSFSQVSTGLWTTYQAVSSKWLGSVFHSHTHPLVLVSASYNNKTSLAIWLTRYSHRV